MGLEIAPELRLSSPISVGRLTVLLILHGAGRRAHLLPVTRSISK